MPSSLELSRTVRFAYPLALALIVSPLLEIMVRAWPLQIHLVQWRFQTEVSIINSSAPMLVGFLILGAIAYTAESPVALRFGAALAASFAILLLPVLALLYLDSVQVRQMAQSNVRGAIRNNVIVAVLRGAIAASAAFSLAIGLWRASRLVTDDGKRYREPGLRASSAVDDDDALLVSVER